MKIRGIIMLLLLAMNSAAQSYIKGKVTDSLYAPVPFCSLALLNASDSSLFKGAITNEKGEFVFSPVAKGTYFIRISTIGFADHISAVMQIDSTSQLILPAIVLKQNASSLKEVNVTAIQPTIEFKDGNVVMNVENNILASGNTVLELLKQLPGVSVDVQNNITVDGQSGVRFMIDGKLQQLPMTQMIALLSGMNAEMIQSLVLIKNPPAKYDAAGTAGLINIVMKKAKMKGFNASVSESAGYGKRFGSGTAASFNFKSDKLSVFSNVGYTNRDFIDVINSNRSLSNSTGNYLFTAAGDNKMHKEALNVSAGLEYELAPKTTVGFTLNDAWTSAKPLRTLRTDIAGPFPGYNYYVSATSDNDRYVTPSVTIYAQHTFDTLGTTLAFSADYTAFTFSETQLSENKFYYSDATEALPMLAYRSTTNLDFKIATQKLDFTKALTKKVMLETGLKSSFTSNSNHSGVEENIPGTQDYFTDPLFTNRYQYHEQIYAAYANVITSLQKLTLQTGLRAEETMINATNASANYRLKRNYINFFPNLSLDYKQNEKNNLQFSYSYRINRPAYDLLNPGRIFNDQLDYWAGNPQLKPEYSHNFHLDLHHGSVITNSFSYTYINNSIYHYSFTREGSQVNVDTVFNFAARSMLAYTLFVQKQFAGFYNLRFSGMAAYITSNGMVNDASGNSDAVTFRAMMNNDFALPAGIRLQLMLSGSTPFNDGIQHYSGRGSVDVAIQRRFLKNALTVSIGCYDLFYTDYGSMSAKMPGQSLYYLEKNDTRRIRLNLSFNIGNMRIDRKVNENADDDRLKKAK